MDSKYNEPIGLILPHLKSVLRGEYPNLEFCYHSNDCVLKIKGLNLHVAFGGSKIAKFYSWDDDKLMINLKIQKPTSHIWSDGDRIKVTRGGHRQIYRLTLDLKLVDFANEEKFDQAIKSLIKKTHELITQIQLFSSEFHLEREWPQIKLTRWGETPEIIVTKLM